MTMRASINLPPSPSTSYVRIDLDGDPVGYLRKRYYDVVCRTAEEFDGLMQLPGAEEEAHSAEGRWVVRLRGEYALAALRASLKEIDLVVDPALRRYRQTQLVDQRRMFLGDTAEERVAAVASE